ncbi:MAG: glycerol-3-phosphate dehydrogenase/oxidase, partial [Acidobacteriota bacterium]
AEIKRRTQPWDIVVIGGGATGGGCALAGASRGLDVLLLEQHDFGKGTSSRSTKLIHGGVRYLKQGNFSLVREALRERGLLLRNAPHVVKDQIFVIPCYSLWQKLFYGLGMKAYDLMSGSSGISGSRMLSQSETLDRISSVRSDHLAGGVQYHDGQFDDSRLLIDILRTASRRGAVVLNYAKVQTIDRDTGGKLTSLSFEDKETAGRINVSGKVFINAAGIFSDEVRRMSDSTAERKLTFSQGVHLVFDRRFLPGDAAIMIPKTSDGRVLFCIPWHDHVVIGTTDTPVAIPELEPEAMNAEIDFILETAAGHLKIKPLRADILSVFAGIRPLIKDPSSIKTSSLSRGHELYVDPWGLVTITGGKWTTYRQMAEDAVDKATEVGRLAKMKCVTKDLAVIPPLKHAGAGEFLHPSLPYTREDVVAAVRDEMARTVEDVLARRMRALFLDARAAIDISAKVASIMAGELGKGPDWVRNEVEVFRELAGSYLAPTA